MKAKSDSIDQQQMVRTGCCLEYKAHVAWNKATVPATHLHLLYMGDKCVGDRKGLHKSGNSFLFPMWASERQHSHLHRLDCVYLLLAERHELLVLVEWVHLHRDNGRHHLAAGHELLQLVDSAVTQPNGLNQIVMVQLLQLLPPSLQQHGEHSHIQFLHQYLYLQTFKLETQSEICPIFADRHGQHVAAYSAHSPLRVYSIY